MIYAQVEQPDAGRVGYLWRIRVGADKWLGLLATPDREWVLEWSGVQHRSRAGVFAWGVPVTMTVTMSSEDSLTWSVRVRQNARELFDLTIEQAGLVPGDWGVAFLGSHDDSPDGDGARFHLAEHMSFHHVLTDDERQGMLGYLREKWATGGPSMYFDHDRGMSSTGEKLPPEAVTSTEET